MRIIIVGAGIGGLTTALALHRIGITVEIYEQARELAELGVGINILPPATHVLAGHGLLQDLDRCAIRTHQLVYMNRLGQEVWREPRGRAAGHGFPQFSVHRGRLHALLARTVRDRIGAHHLHTGCAFVGLHDRGTHVVARFKRRLGSGEFEDRGDALIGCDGIHSAVRARLYPDAGPPIWSGIMLWRGAVDWPVHGDGRTMLIAGGSAAKFVFYPTG